MMRCREAAGFTPRVRREVRETHSLVCFVAAGYGVSLVPASVEHLQTTGIVYRPLTDSTETVAMAMITRRDETSPAVEAFVRWVHSHLTRELDRTPAAKILPAATAGDDGPGG
jgi:DNA-binding transcriptional LysR family regulator